MMQALGAVVTIGNLLLCLVVGSRLIQLGRRTSGGPELSLGLFFIAYFFLANALSCVLYMGWADASLTPPELVLRGLSAAYVFFAGIGVVGLLHFLRVTFRQKQRWSLPLAAVIGAATFGGAVYYGLSEGFSVRVVNGAGYWVSFCGRVAPFVWLAVESFLYWRRMERRLRIGLADPVVSNRFLLIGVWSSIAFLLALTDPAARLLYFLRSGTTDVWDPVIGLPIILWVIPTTSLFAALGAVALFLAFFPLEGYRRWLSQRSVPLDSDA
ncbi:MAG: hypothetical protein E2O66_05950 [Deltaproteobacteria bacterium]|nr:MAG: hypothetical protein E2O66_05950 [Deltaproteobacteria bacterium]